MEYEVGASRNHINLAFCVLKAPTLWTALTYTPAGDAVFISLPALFYTEGPMT